MNDPRRLLPCVVLALSLSFGPPARADDLYHALGERPGIERIVVAAARLWLADARVSRTFDDVNMDRFRRRLADQICELSGGPCHYAGRDMRDAHRGLDINRAQFNAVAEDLQLALDQQEIPFRVQNRLLALLAPMQRDVVSR